MFKFCKSSSSKHIIKRFIVCAGASTVLAGALAVPAFAASNNGAGGTVHGVGSTTTTTLDACGFFLGTQTQTQYHTFTKNGVLHDNERGTWTGVTNVEGSKVASLGNVSGTYVENYTISKTGMLKGTEEFHSSVGNIAQQFSFNAATFSDFNVNVVATGELSFMTSNTNGHCYTGPSPRQ